MESNVNRGNKDCKAQVPKNWANIRKNKLKEQTKAQAPQTRTTKLKLWNPPTHPEHPLHTRNSHQNCRSKLNEHKFLPRPGLCPRKQIPRSKVSSRQPNVTLYSTVLSMLTPCLTMSLWLRISCCFQRLSSNRQLWLSIQPLKAPVLNPPERYWAVQRTATVQLTTTSYIIILKFL